MKINYTQRWLFIASLFVCLFASSANAQIVFSEDFDGNGTGTGLPTGWTLFNVDARTPNANVAYVTGAWIRREDFANNVNDSAAFSTSWYDPVGAADDWMFTPAITVPANAVLKWNAVAYDASYPDGYQVRILNAAPTVGNIASSTVLQTISAENGTWTARTQSLAAYAGQTVYIAFRNNSNNQFVLLVDDVVVEVQVNNDVELVSTTLPNQYTILHAPQGQAFTLGGTVRNNGLNAQTNVTLTATVRDGAGASVYSASSTPVASLASGATQNLTVTGFTPTVVGDYYVTYSVQSAQTDQVPANNVDTSITYSVDANVYARDNGNVVGGLGIGAGDGGYLGQDFDVNVPSTAIGVGVYIIRGYTGRRLALTVWNFAAGEPSTIIGSTDTILYPDDSARFYILEFNPPLNLAAGRYAFTAVEFDSTLQLGQSDSIFTLGRTWVDWPSSPVTGWANNEDFGPGFSRPYVLRPIFCAAITVATTSQTNVGCRGASTGAATVAAAGGTAPYTYLWSNAANTASISGVAAGTYTVTATDALGCTGVATVTITQPAAAITLGALPTITNASCGGACDGAISNVVIVGGTSPYTYLWSNGATTANISSLCPGTYTGTVTDANGCTFVSPPITISAAGTIALTGTPSTTNITCNGLCNGSISGVAVTGGTAPYTYAWSNGASTANLSNLCAGSYTLTVTDNGGCSFTLPIAITITQPAVLAVPTPAVSNITCNGLTNGSITVAPTGGTTPYSYAWSPSGGTAATASGLSTGAYTVSVTDANGCTASASATITQPTALGLSGFPTATNVNCFGDSTGSVTGLNPTGGTTPYTYLWSNGATTQSITGLPAGTYNGTVTDANGCTLSSPTGFTITQPATALGLSGFPTVGDISCNGSCDGSVTGLVPTGGVTPYTYSWSNGATTPDVTGLCAGNYNGTITDANGCTLSSPTGFAVTEPDTISIQAIITDATTVGSADGAINAVVSGGTAPYTIDWSNGATTEDLTGVVKGTYVVTVTDFNGCIDAATFVVGGPVGISVLDKEGAISIYPNPASTNMSISITLPEVAPVTVKVFDMKGGLVHEVSGKALQSHNLLLDVSKWAEGIYNVTITSMNETTTKRIAVNR
jgi:hypothetical protein